MMHPGVRMLWSHRTGDVLSAAGVAHPRQRFVIDTASGRLVMPLARSVLEGGSITLCVPEDHEGAAQALCEACEADAARDGRSLDRWQAYHGTARGVMACLEVAAVKYGGEVVDDERLCLRSPLASAESALVRLANRDASRLGEGLRRALGVDLVGPLVVGVDALGLDVRTRVGVVRAPFGQPARTAADAEAAIVAMLGCAR